MQDFAVHRFRRRHAERVQDGRRQVHDLRPAHLLTRLHVGSAHDQNPIHAMIAAHAEYSTRHAVVAKVSRPERDVLQVL